MAVKMKMMFRLFAIYAKMDVLWALRDSKYCLIQITGDAVAALASMAGVFLLASRFGNLGGMNRPQILFMLGYGILVDGIYKLFFINSNAGQISRVIGRGQLDHAMIQPVPVWIQLLTSGFAPASGSSIFLCGVGMTAYAVSGLSIPITAAWLFQLAICLLSSTAIMVSVIYIISCLAFLAPVAAEEIAGSVVEMFSVLRSYPLGGMRIGLRILFTGLIPIGLAAWYPAARLADAGTPDGFSPTVYMLSLATVFISIAVILFKKGINYYGTYGSPRYSGFGHR